MYVSNSGFTTRQTIVAVCLYFFVFFKQKTAYEMRISDWSSDVCSSDLAGRLAAEIHRIARLDLLQPRSQRAVGHLDRQKFELVGRGGAGDRIGAQQRPPSARQADNTEQKHGVEGTRGCRSVEHGSRLTIKKKRKKKYRRVGSIEK